uniref:Uncharacterized protein n=1 Tax=uncultured bacterium 34R1 TaxID=581113 RepID=C0K030_9BACT|nr:unknown [uncultured bacterium 34R1]
MMKYLTKHLITVALTLVLGFAVHAADIPEQSVVLPGIDTEQMKARFAESDMQPMEGIWYYPDEEMTLAIEKWKGEHNIGYRLILLESTDLELLPGTVVGFIEESAVDNKYRLWLYTERSKITLASPAQCVATLNSDATSLTFDPPHWKVKVRVNFVSFSRLSSVAFRSFPKRWRRSCRWVSRRFIRSTVTAMLLKL